jgi:hypothetical protein
LSPDLIAHLSGGGTNSIASLGDRELEDQLERTRRHALTTGQSQIAEEARAWLEFSRVTTRFHDQSRDLRCAINYYYEQAAARGNVEALFVCGWLYHNGGVGLAPDLPRAINCYQQAADRGHVKAVRELGRVYYTGGHGVEADWRRAISYYEQAAAKGDVDSLFWIGMCYYVGGYGVTIDWPQAIAYFQEAAAKGHLDALYSIAKCYDEGGHGIAANEVTARQFYERAAARGDARAEERAKALALRLAPSPYRDWDFD